MLSVKADSLAQGLCPPQRKYYFHIASECVAHADNRGVFLSDLAAAHRCAISVISKCIYCDPEEQDWSGWHVKIADYTGRTLMIVPFTALREAFGHRINAEPRSIKRPDPFA